jgi:hypothetical protein
MKSQHLFALVFRLLGLLLGFQSLGFLPMIGFMFVKPNPGGPSSLLYVVPQIAGFVLSLIGVYILFFKARWMAERVVSSDEHIDAQGAIHADADCEAVFRLLLRIVGAIAIAWAIPELAGQGMGHTVYYRMDMHNLWTTLLPGLVKLSIGVYLLRGGSQVVLFAYGSRDADRGGSADNPDRVDNGNI